MAIPPLSRTQAASLLQPGQRVFAERFSQRTGLDPGVVAGWLLAEESGPAAAARQQAGNFDWLNIGYTDSATYGASDPAWTDPQQAADRSAEWLAGTWAPRGYGRSSAGVRSILDTAGQDPAAQVQAIQQSGWASSGYPNLPADVAMFGGVDAGGGTTIVDGVPKPYVPPAPISSNPRPGVSGGGGSDFWDSVEGGAGSVLGAVESAGGSVFGAVQGTAEGLVTSSLGFLKAALWLVNPLSWLRLAEALFGGVMIGVGVAVLTGAASAFARVAAARTGIPLGAAPAGAALGAAATRGAETRRAVRTGERQAELARARQAGRQGRRRELAKRRPSAQDDRSPLFG